MHPCPAGHYCPGGNESHPGIPQPCPEHTFLAAEGGQSLAACLPCPAGYQCPSPGEDAEPSGESREVTWQPQAAGFLASAFAQVSLPLKTTHALQATGVQVVRVPFSAHLAPFGQSQEPRHGKTVSTVPPATTAQGLSRAAGQACLRSPVALDLSVLQVGPQPLALSPPGPAPASHLSPELWPGGRGASQGTAWPPVWPREPSAQSPKARPGPQDPPSLVGSGPPGLQDRGPQPVPVSSGAVAEATCRAGSYCGPQTGVPPLCPGGYACPAGSSTYTGPGQL